MFAHHHQTSASQQYASPFLPATPSPLSPRSANIYGRGPVFMSDEPLKPQDRAQQAKPAFSNRAIKKAPIAGQDALKEKRRELFLKKVKEGREDRRFESRGEDIMRIDFVQRRKQWEAEQARSAPSLPSDPVEEDDESEAMYVSRAMPMSVQGLAPEEEADEVALREREELEALLSLLPGEEEPVQREDQYDGFHLENTSGGDEEMSEHFGSDDDDYDALFLDYIHSDVLPDTQQQQKVQAQDLLADAMDIS